MKTRRKLPKYCSEFKDRHGKWRVRFRRKGQEGHYFKATPWTAAFMAEYQACLDKTQAPKIEPGAARTKAGTVSALIASYYSSPEYLGNAATTRRVTRNIIEKFRAEHGGKRVAAIERKHLKAIIGKKAGTPEAANKLLALLKVLMKFAVDIGMRRDDPSRGIRGFKSTSEGHHSWTEEEIGLFEQRHPVGSRARLAMALLLYTGQRRGDVIGMGWQHVADGRISVKQQKTSARLQVPMHPQLRAVLADTPREHLAFLTTVYGKPFSAAGFGNWFRERCDEAGLKHCSAHGLRKAAARRLAEAGCTNQQIKAVTGHKTDREVSRYVAAANQVHLAEQAMDAIGGTNGEQIGLTSAEKLDTSDAKSLNREGK